MGIFRGEFTRGEFDGCEFSGWEFPDTIFSTTFNLAFRSKIIYLMHVCLFVFNNSVTLKNFEAFTKILNFSDIAKLCKETQAHG